MKGEKKAVGGLSLRVRGGEEAGGGEARGAGGGGLSMMVSSVPTAGIVPLFLKRAGRTTGGRRGSHDGPAPRLPRLSLPSAHVQHSRPLRKHCAGGGGAGGRQGRAAVGERRLQGGAAGSLLLRVPRPPPHPTPPPVLCPPPDLPSNQRHAAQPLPKRAHAAAHCCEEAATGTWPAGSRPPLFLQQTHLPSSAHPPTPPPTLQSSPASSWDAATASAAK